MSRAIESTMRQSRQFVNLIMTNLYNGAKSLYFVDLKRQPLFKTPLPPTASTDGDRFETQDAFSQTQPTESLVLERLRLPRPSFQFETSTAQDRSWYINCLPLSDRVVFCSDQCGHNFVVDGIARCLVTMPSLHKRKMMPLSIFIPSTDVEGGGSLFLVDRSPGITATRVEFESLVYRKASFSNTYSWQAQLLPPAPYPLYTSYSWQAQLLPPAPYPLYTKISSYAVIGGGSHICLSVKNEGTYCLDTTRHTWSKVGTWTLPFDGKVEYVPELKLWFGASADRQKLAATDLSYLSSTVDSATGFQPEVLGSWMELTLPEGWEQKGRTQLVNLGSGRFCVARFMNEMFDPYGSGYVLLTGVEIVPHFDNLTGNDVSSGSGDGSKGKLKLQIIPHKSWVYMPTTPLALIQDVF
jgi:hypothetical protein